MLNFASIEIVLDFDKKLCGEDKEFVNRIEVESRMKRKSQSKDWIERLNEKEVSIKRSSDCISD